VFVVVVVAAVVSLSSSKAFRQHRELVRFFLQGPKTASANRPSYKTWLLLFTLLKKKKTFYLLSWVSFSMRVCRCCLLLALRLFRVIAIHTPFAFHANLPTTLL